MDWEKMLLFVFSGVVDAKGDLSIWGGNLGTLQKKASVFDEELKGRHTGPCWKVTQKWMTNISVSAAL